MQDNKKEQLELLEAFYESLVPNHMRLFRAFIESEFEFESGYSSDHFYRTNQEHFEGASFPLPVIEVAGVCEVFINVDSKTPCCRSRKELTWQKSEQTETATSEKGRTVSGN